MKKYIMSLLVCTSMWMGASEEDKLQDQGNEQLVKLSDLSVEDTVVKRLIQKVEGYRATINDAIKKVECNKIISFLMGQPVYDGETFLRNESDLLQTICKEVKWAENSRSMKQREDCIIQKDVILQEHEGNNVLKHENQYDTIFKKFCVYINTVMVESYDHYIQLCEYYEKNLSISIEKNALYKNDSVFFPAKLLPQSILSGRIQGIILDCSDMTTDKDITWMNCHFQRVFFINMKLKSKVSFNTSSFTDVTFKQCELDDFELHDCSFTAVDMSDLNVKKRCIQNIKNQEKITIKEDSFLKSFFDSSKVTLVQQSNEGLCDADYPETEEQGENNSNDSANAQHDIANKADPNDLDLVKKPDYRTLFSNWTKWHTLTTCGGIGLWWWMNYKGWDVATNMATHCLSKIGNVSPSTASLLGSVGKSIGSSTSFVGKYSGLSCLNTTMYKGVNSAIYTGSYFFSSSFGSAASKTLATR